jgi:antitoxin component YwqK of YwqJK toxin-antitoxin module
MRFYALLFLFLVPVSLFSQGDDWFDNIENITDNVEEPMLYYERFNAFTMGDSVRLCNKKPCNGIQKDFWENGIIKHKAYYQNGRITNGYENYFDNEQLERKFTIINASSAELVVYYKDGTLRSKVEYRRKNAVKWADYYPNGNLEFIEEYDNSMEYYIKYNFYFMNGSPQSTLELVDKNERIYTAKTYYKNGQLKEEGFRQLNMAAGDYVRIGEWKYYDEEGKLIETHNFHKGEEIEDGSEEITE